MELKEYHGLYTSLAFTNNYILGFLYDNDLYIYYTDMLDINLMKLEKSGKKEKSKTVARLRISKKVQKNLIASGQAVKIASGQEFEKFGIDKKNKDNKNYNKGDLLEYYIYTLNNQTYKQNPNRFYNTSDIKIDNVHYQVKLDGGQLASVDGLKRISVQGW